MWISFAYSILFLFKGDKRRHLDQGRRDSRDEVNKRPRKESRDDCSPSYVDRRRYSQDEPMPSTSTQCTANSETDERRNSLEGQSDHREETDKQPCDEDRFEMHNIQQVQSTEAKEEEPCYHPEQVQMAMVLMERIREILFRNVYSRRSVKAYKKLEFMIYTAQSKMLEKQTISRLCDPSTECFSPATYLNVRKLCAKAEQKVRTFSVENIGKIHRKLEAEVKQNPDTLYLVVADEAHSAITKETKKKENAANNTVVNSWNSVDHPNVIVLQASSCFICKRSFVLKY